VFGAEAKQSECRCMHGIGGKREMWRSNLSLLKVQPQACEDRYMH
jgi:hypothetical protein